jgi:hypothetical protein
VRIILKPKDKEWPFPKRLVKIWNRSNVLQRSLLYMVMLYEIQRTEGIKHGAIM